jgi:ribosomal subunit interface protein
MKLIIHTRHVDLAEDFSQFVQEKINSLERFSVLIERIEVEILHEANPRQGKHAHHVIITTHGAGPLMRAEAQSFNDLAAFDEAVKSIELQIRKIHETSKSKNRDSMRFKSEAN